MVVELGDQFRSKTAGFWNIAQVNNESGLSKTESGCKQPTFQPTGGQSTPASNK